MIGFHTLSFKIKKIYIKFKIIHLYYVVKKYFFNLFLKTYNISNYSINPTKYKRKISFVLIFFLKKKSKELKS